MSLILDALNKAQRERQELQQNVPQLTSIQAPLAPAPQARKWLAMAGAAALVLAAVGFVAGQKLAQPEAVAIEFGAGVEPASRAAVLPAEAKPEDDVSVAGAPHEPQGESASEASTPVPRDLPEEPLLVDPAIAELYSAARNATGADSAFVDAVDPAAETTSVPAPEVEVFESTARRSETAEAVAEAKPASEPVTQPATPASTVTLAGRPDVPLVQELSWNIQQQLPSLLYGRHHFSADGQSYVELNGTRYGSGSRIAEGLVLEEILEDGIVLSHRQRSFKLEALNSWVNF